MKQRPTQSLDALLSETDWLRALARQLVHDQSSADDLYQETVLSVVEGGAPSHDPLRPWLARVARNLASKLRRSEARRVTREQHVAVARGNSEASVLESLQSFAMLKTVVLAVEELAEPYHTTIVLRFWDDLPPREIARRMEISVETVKTRLKRGLTLLRGRLDRDFGSRGVWTTALLPFLHTGKAASGGVTAGLGTFGTLGVLAMAKFKFAAVAAAVALVAATAWLGYLWLDNGAARLSENRFAVRDMDQATVGTAHNGTWGHPSIALRSRGLPGDVHTDRSEKLRAVPPARMAQHFFQILRNKTKIPGAAWPLRETSLPRRRGWAFDGCPGFG